MITVPLAVGFIMGIVGVIWIAVALILMAIILVQKSKGGGLSAAFGGGSAGGLLGTKTGDFLTWVTISLVAVFFVLSLVMVKWYKPSQAKGLESPTAGTNTINVPDNTGEEATVPTDEDTSSTNIDTSEIEDAVNEGIDAAGEAVDNAIDDAASAVNDILNSEAGDTE